MSNVFEIDIGIPSSFTSNLQSLIQRSFAVALLARAASIFGVNFIYVYRDPLSHDADSEKQIVKLLKYLVTPPYMKKILFRRDRDLSYVGMLPPLTLDSHKEWTAIKNLTYPEYRIGYVIGRKSGRYLVDVGLDKPVAIRKKPRSNIVTVEIVKSTSKYLIGNIISRDAFKEKGLYPGYIVKRVKVNLINFLRSYEGSIICLTRYGEYFGDIYKDLKRDLSQSSRIILLLGSYEYGLDKILEYYGVSMNDICDYKVNLVRYQKVETIRVEEAVLIGLSMFDLIRNNINR